VITDTGNLDYDLIEKRSAAGAQTPPHIHDGYSELVYVIEGEMAVHTKEQSYTLKPGQHFLVQKGMPHFLEATQNSGITRTLQTFAPVQGNLSGLLKSTSAPTTKVLSMLRDGPQSSRQQHMFLYSFERC
jgi:glyoxylate utilization-related uncharacterized protein